MGILLVDKGLQKNASQWISNKSASVNDPASDYFEATQLSDGSMSVANTYAGTKQYAGALVSNKSSLPYYNGNLLQYVSMHVGWNWPYSIYYNIARHELDLKVCVKSRPNASTPIRNVANFSTQWNRDTGQFQIDGDPPGWLNTGYIVPDIPADEDHDLFYNFWYDPVTLVFSVLSIQLDNNAPYMIPADLQNVPMSLTNWEEVRSIQIQNEMFNPGCTVIHYDSVDLVWSDAPINSFPL